MKFKRCIVVMSFLLAVSPSVLCGEPELTADDIVGLTEAGFSDKLIILKIRSSGAVFDLAAEEMIDLKEKGVSEDVIAEMLNTERRVSAGKKPANRKDAAAERAEPSGEGILLFYNKDRFTGAEFAVQHYTGKEIPERNPGPMGTENRVEDHDMYEVLCTLEIPGRKKRNKAGKYGAAVKLDAGLYCLQGNDILCPCEEIVIEDGDIYRVDIDPGLHSHFENIKCDGFDVKSEDITLENVETMKGLHWVDRK